jgi:hypothetical protein
MENYNRIKKENWATYYYLNDKLHRTDGPAIEYANGSKYWWQNGLKHRINGPAVEWTDGSKSWWFKGKKIKCDSQEEFERYIKLKLFW